MASQDYAQITALCAVSNTDAEKLAAVIRQQPITQTVGWGEPVVTNERTVWFNLRRGPMLGAWPADIKRSVDRLIADSGTGGDLEVRESNREVLMKRAVYDGQGEAPPAPPAPEPPQGMTSEAQATHVAMGSPEVIPSEHELTLVRVKDEVWAIYPDGLVQSPRDGTPRPLT
jgi:hypothetical protein